MPIPIAGLLAGASKIAGSPRKPGSGRQLASSIVKREPKKSETTSSSESNSSSALALRPKQSMVPYKNIEPTPETDGMGMDDKLIVINTKIVEVDKLLKGTLAAEKTEIDEENKQKEIEDQKKQEDELEKGPDKKDGKDKGKFKLPGAGFLDPIKNFFLNIGLGFILTRLVGEAPRLQGIVGFIGGTIEFAANLITGIIDGLGSFLAVGLKAYRWAEGFLRERSGEEGVERFHELTKQLTNLFNAAIIVGSLMVAAKQPKPKPLDKLKDNLKRNTSKKAIERYTRRFGGDAAKNKFGRAGQAAANRLGVGKSQIIKGGLGKTTTRLGLKLIGKKGVQLVSKTFGRIPIVGSLIVAVSSLLAGEPLGQAVFKGLGAAIGGLVGSFIPIPVIGTVIGSSIGTFMGDVLYTLILQKDPKAAGQKFMKGITDAFKLLFDLGGLAGQFIKEGFKRFIDNFPTIDIPSGFGLQTALGKAAELFGVKDSSEFMEDGRIVKLPNLALLSPVGLPFLIPHIGASFLPDIFGQGGVVNKIFGSNGTAWGGSGQSSGSSGFSGSSGQKKVDVPAVNMETAQDTGNQSEGSKIAGRLGRFLNERGLRWGSGVTEHPEHGGVNSVHATNSYHYVGRAIDIGGWGPNRYAREGMTGVDDQTKIIQGIREFNKKEGVKPVEFLHEGNEPYGHNDHVHIAYRLGGFTKGMAHKAVLGEEGREFVFDADTTAAIERKVPGLLTALNKADGSDALKVLENYASYDDPQAQIFVMESPSNQIPTPLQKQPQSKMMIFGGSSDDDFTEFLASQG